MLLNEEEDTVSSTIENLEKTLRGLDAITTLVCWDNYQVIMFNRMENGHDWLISTYYGWNMSNSTTEELKDVVDTIKEMNRPNIELYLAREMLKAQERVFLLNKKVDKMGYLKTSYSGHRSSEYEYGDIDGT